MFFIILLPYASINLTGSKGSSQLAKLMPLVHGAFIYNKEVIVNSYTDSSQITGI